MIFSRKRPWRKVPPRNQIRPLRLMFVITSMPVGGAETLLVNMLRRMDPESVQPEVVCLKEPGPLGEQISGEFPVHANMIAAKWDLRILYRLARLFHRQRTDVVITIGAGDKMFWGRLAAHIAGVPCIASALHSTGWPDGVGKANRALTRIQTRSSASLIPTANSSVTLKNSQPTRSMSFAMVWIVTASNQTRMPAKAFVMSLDCQVIRSLSGWWLLSGAKRITACWSTPRPR